MYASKLASIDGRMRIQNMAERRPPSHGAHAVVRGQFDVRR